MMASTALWHDIESIRAETPLVHNITNFVVMNLTANSLLAVGASPVMSHAVEEVEEMVQIARALVINIGTLSAAWVDAMVLAGREAVRRGIPIVLDPVGAGATHYRTSTIDLLLREFSPTVIRGNASEILALVQDEHSTHGVDSTHDAEEAIDAARILSDRCGCVVSVSGVTDVIVSGERIVRVRNGHAWMPLVTGMGCTASALTGAFAAVNAVPLEAAAHAMALNGIAGEIAAERSRGTGTFQAAYIDALFLMQEEDVSARLRLEVG